MPIALAPFDAARDFVANTSFRADGTIWLRKRPFDKYRVNLRVLRQLYEARKIGYDDGTALEAEATPTPPGDETPVDKHEDDIAPTGADKPEAGDEGGAADSDLDENDETTEAAAVVPNAPAEEEGADAASGGSATAAPASDKPQLDHDHDGEPGGSEADNTGDRDAMIKRLVGRYTHDVLFTKASGLAGVTKGQTKAEIAAALVDAGRVGDDGAA